MKIEEIPYDIGHPKTCPICGGKVSYLESKKYDSGYMYSCDNCHAQVGTYAKSKDIAMGIIADSETRKKRKELHKLLDRFWRGQKTRTKLYQRLAAELGIQESVCHFAYMDYETLCRAEQILLGWWREKYDI